jgi:hypothetical protein
MPHAYPASVSASRHVLLATLALAATASSALAQLRVCTWNVTNYSTSSTDRTAAFQTAFYGVVPTGLALAGKSMSPDVVIGQEFLSQAGVTQFKNLLNAAPGSPGDWAAAPFLDGPDSDSAFFYRTSKVQYIGTTTIALGSSDTNNQPRDTRRYDFRPVGYAAPQSVMAAYSVHLKAQGGTNDDGRRLLECQRIRSNASGANTNGAGSALPAGYSFIMAGDTNITSSSSTEYQALVGSQTDNTGRFFDPINTPGNWNNNAAFHFVHTQEPSTQMDDRHDQMLVSASLKDGAGLDYIGNTAIPYSTSTWNDPNHSYRCWGNDGGSFDLPIRTTANTMVGQAIAEALITTVDSGGHLPVFADFRVPAVFSASSQSLDLGTVDQNDAASTTLTITNAGDVNKWTVAGISNLRYTMTVTGPFALTGAGAQQTEAPGGGGNVHTVTMNTSTTGHKAGSVTITTDAPDTPSYTITLSGDVQTPPPPPCAADLGHQGGLPGGDGQLDNNDFIAFISAFFAADPVADLGHQGGLPGADGQFDNNDFIAFISAFFAGGP